MKQHENADTMDWDELDNIKKPKCAQTPEDQLN